MKKSAGRKARSPLDYPLDPRVLIVAGTRAQAEVWAKAERLPRGAWTYASSPELLLGWTANRIILCGNWFEHPDATRIMPEVRKMEARLAAYWKRRDDEHT